MSVITGSDLLNAATVLVILYAVMLLGAEIHQSWKEKKNNER